MKGTDVTTAIREAREPSFKALMLVYELLYLKLEHLLGQEKPAGVRVSCPAGAQPIYHERLETHPYVTVEHLSYRFPAHDTAQQEPDAVIKRYHDAHTAELLSCVPDQHVARFCHPDTAMGAALKGRWQMNRFLLKWCDYLLDQGHGWQTFELVDKTGAGE